MISNKETKLSSAEKKALYGGFAANPEEFEILMGEKVLLKKIVNHTKKKLEEYGNNYFQSTSSVHGVTAGLIICCINKPLIFTDCDNDNSAPPDDRTNKTAVTTHELNPPEINCSTAPNLESRTSLSENNSQNVDDDDDMRSLLLDKIIDKFATQLAAIDNSQDGQNANFLRKLANITVDISRNDGIVGGLCGCFCGAKLKVTFHQNRKSDSGYWNLYNLARHINNHVKK